MEWKNSNKYNEFNSDKGLTYFEHYKAIDEWMAGKRTDLVAPIECSLDPIASCNLKCYYCNSQRYLRINPDEIPQSHKIMSKAYMRKLIDFLGDWGVKGVCLGGGGESLLNKDAQELPSYIASRGMQPAVMTNGTIMNHTTARNMCYCKFVAFSVDAHDAQTYLTVHGVDKFGEVCENIRYLIDMRDKEGSSVIINFRLLILPENYQHIFEACTLAKELGVNAFHARPVDFQRKDYMGDTYEFDMKEIEHQFALCHEIEDDKFKVYTVMHKFTEDFKVKHDFHRCLASPLVIQCCTDGNAYVCVDHRIEKRFLLGEHAPDKGGAIAKLKRRAGYPEPTIKEWWGSDEHRKLLQSIKPDEECSRCTWSQYNRQFEETVLEDRMCLSFP